MQKRKIGSLDVSIVGVGCNNFGRRLDADGTAAVVKAALDEGINFFDTANTYGHGRSEEFLGRAIAGRRNEVVIATKFGSPFPGTPKGASPALIRSAVEGSLRRLGIEVIDLYQLHEPDADVPIADTLGELARLVDAGIVREIGCSNFTAVMLRDAAEASAANAGARFVSVQNELSLVHRKDELDGLLEAERLGLAYLPYYPLASGLLTGKYRKGAPLPEGTRLTEGGHYDAFLQAENLDTVERLIAFAEANGGSILDVAFAWLLGKPAVSSVIAGARSAEQIRLNARAADWRLSAEQLAQIDAAAPARTSHPV